MDSDMITHNIQQGLRLMDHFVQVQNRYMTAHRDLPQHNMPEMWRPDLGGMNGLTEQDWFDLLAAWHVYHDTVRPWCDSHMLQAAHTLGTMITDDTDRFVRDLGRPGRGSRYKTAAWRFMMALRETMNRDEGIDPFAPQSTFHDLFPS